MVSWTLSLGGCTASPRPVQRELGKCIWVSRYEYRSRDHIDEIMRRIATAGFDTVFFQVRGNGTVLFSSRTEIWSENFDYTSPGFDPLSHAVVAAHARGLKLHAWVNMLPGWRGDEPPEDARQLFRRRPEWFMRRADGQLTIEGHYKWLNPCLPVVRSYLIGICEEVASGFGVDGLHLDYIRFPYGADSKASPRDQRSLAIFTRQTGRPASDDKAFREWKTNCVTEVVAGVRQRLQRLPRRVLLTAAVSPNLRAAREEIMQDWPTWARRRLVDAVLPMNYTLDDNLFDSRCRELIAVADGIPVVMGIGVAKHQAAKLDPKATMMQMDAAIRAGASGVCLFSYGSSLRGKWTAAMTYWNRTRKLGR